MALLRFVSLILIALWIGGLIALGAIAAPTVFSVLQDYDPLGGRTLAGEVFGAVFRRFQPVSWTIGGLLLVSLVIRAALGPRPRRLAVRLWLVITMLAISVGTAWLIVPRIDRIRREVPGVIANLADDDPRKLTFNRLHGLSNGLMLLTVVVGCGLMWFESRDPH